MSVPMISDGHNRKVPEWIGKDADAKPPQKVVLRVWRREKGIDHWTGKKIYPGELWDLEHKIAITRGGENRESNLGLIVRGKSHKEKTAIDRREQARGDRAAKRHAGIRKKSRFPGSRDSNLKKTIDGRVIDRRTGEEVRPR